MSKFEQSSMPEKQSSKPEKENGKTEERREKHSEKKFEIKNERELSPEFVNLVEALNLNTDDKINLLLTKAGLKPASEINFIIKREYEGEKTELISEEELQKALNIIKELKLPFQLGEREIVKESYQTKAEPEVEKNYQKEQMRVLIGRSKEELDFLIQSLKTGSGKLLGKALGYPPTAIEAFMGKRETLDINMLPKEIQESDALLFSSPTLSKDNWEEEVKQGQRNADFIKKISPIIYEEMKTVEKGEPATEKSEKEIIWENKQKEIENSTDQLGRKIDDQIKETVITFNVIGLSTLASCEGHVDRGYSAPWVEVGAPNMPEERFIGEKEIFQKVADKYGVSLEDVKRGINHKARVEAMKKSSKTDETPEYKQWREETKKLMDKASGLLEEFYKNREISSNIRLEISEGGEGEFRIKNGGEDYKVAAPEKLTDERKKELSQRLKRYQQEIKEFALFLKNKYFEG